MAIETSSVDRMAMAPISRAERWLAAASYALLVLGPSVALLVATLIALGQGHLDWLELSVPVGRRLVLLRNSLCLAVAVATLATAQGWLVAVGLWSGGGRARRLLVWLALPLAAIPPYVHALTWLALSGALSNWLHPFGFAPLGPYGWGGALWAEVASLTPLALGFAWLGLRGVDPELVEAGRLLRTDFAGLLRIALPLSAPALLTGAGLTFLLSLTDYSVPSLFQITVYPMEIFAEYSASNSPERAFLLALPLMLLAATVATGLLGPLRTVSMRMVLYRPGWGSRPLWPAWFLALQRMAWALVAAEVLLPPVVLVGRVQGLQGFLSSLSQAAGEIRYSLATAGLAALFSLPVALGIARMLSRRRAGGLLWWAAIAAPLAIPGPLVGIGAILVTQGLGLRSSLVSQVLPALVSLARFAPLAALVLLAQQRRLDPLLFEAARLFQPSVARRWKQVELPLLGPGLLASAGVVFALSLGELGATLMVAPPGRATLTMRIYNYLHYGASGTVAGLCLVLGACALLAGAGAAGLMARWFQLFPGAREKA